MKNMEGENEEVKVESVTVSTESAVKVEDVVVKDENASNLISNPDPELPALSVYKEKQNIMRFL